MAPIYLGVTLLAAHIAAMQDSNPASGKLVRAIPDHALPELSINAVYENCCRTCRPSWAF